MATLKQFAANMNKRAGEVDEVGNDAAKRAAETVLASLVYDTPVDTANALSNWQVGIDQKVSAERLPYYPGKHGSTYKQSADAALQAGRAQIAAKKPCQTIYISNLAPYIRRLNNGYSGQHPGGFVEIAVALGRKLLEKLRRG